MDYYEYYEALIPNESQRYNFFYTFKQDIFRSGINSFIKPNTKPKILELVYLFEYIKEQIIDILSEFCPRDYKKILKSSYLGR